MPSDTGAPHEVPYMVDGDPLADVADIMRTLAERVEAITPVRGTATINLAAAASGSVAVVFPVTFATAPIVTATVIRGNHFYIVSADAVTTAGMTLRVQHANSTSFTTAVVVNWSAAPAS